MNNKFKRSPNLNHLCCILETDKEDLNGIVVDLLCEEYLKIEHYEIENNCLLQNLISEDEQLDLARKLLEHYSMDSFYDPEAIVDYIKNIKF